MEKLQLSDSLKDSKGSIKLCTYSLLFRLKYKKRHTFF